MMPAPRTHEDDDAPYGLSLTMNSRPVPIPDAANQMLRERVDFQKRNTYTTPLELYTEICDYFLWNENNPLSKPITSIFKGKVIKDFESRPRVMSIGRMEDFLNIDPQAWKEFRETEGFKDVVLWAEKIIINQKFENASVDLFNANFIARDLGLADKTQHTVTDAAPVGPEIDPAAIADKTHPDDPDPTGMDSGIFPRPMYSQAQIDAGVPFTAPETLPKIIDHEG